MAYDDGVPGTHDRDWQLYDRCPTCARPAGAPCRNKRTGRRIRWVHEDRPVVMTPGSMQGVPNTPGTPRRTIRVPDCLWDAAQAKAEAEGTDVSAVVRKALERYVKRR